jgi:hypothetical protein
MRGYAALVSALAMLWSGAALAAPAPIVFFDIAATDLASQAAFYKAVFDWDASPEGRLTVPSVSPLPGNLRIEAPSAESTIQRSVGIDRTLNRARQRKRRAC